MTVPAPPPRGRHRRSRTGAPEGAGARLSPPNWLRVRRSLTAGLFVLATVAGVGVGLDGATTSPVAPPPAATVMALPAPVPQDLPVAPHPHGHR